MNKSEYTIQNRLNVNRITIESTSMTPDFNARSSVMSKVMKVCFFMLLLITGVAPVLQGSAYFSEERLSEPIEIRPGETDDLFYTVQIGVYGGNFNQATFSGFQPLYTYQLPNGFIRYSSGHYSTEREAITRLEKVIAEGMSDAFITAYHQGERISLAEARNVKRAATGLYLTDRNMIQLRPDQMAGADTLYTVQFGVFNRQLDRSERNDYEPVIIQELPDGRYKYLSGVFATEREAELHLQSLSLFIERDGFSDAFVSAYPVDEQPLLMEQLLMQLAEERESEEQIPAPVAVREAVEEDKDTQADESAVLLAEDDSELTEARDSLSAVQLLAEQIEELQADSLVVSEQDTLIADFTEEQDTLIVDLTEEQDSLITDTVFDVALSVSGLPEVIIKDRLIQFELRITNNGEAMLPAGHRLLLENRGLLLTRVECSSSSENICLNETLDWNAELNVVALPDIPSNETFDLSLFSTTDTDQEVAELYAAILFNEGFVNLDTINSDVLVALLVEAPEQVVQAVESDMDPLPALTGTPLLITIDDELLFLDESSLEEEERGRVENLRGFRTSVSIRADHRERTPFLNITGPGAAVRNQPLFFHAYTNYAAWIDRYELRIFDRNTPSTGQPLAIVSPSDEAGTIFRWSARVPEFIETVRFVLRVYDRDGNFDETLPRELAVVDRPRPERDRDSDLRESRIGFGENSRSIANIPVDGGAVTVTGDKLDPNSAVIVNGRPVPVDANGRFVSRQLEAPGTRLVSVMIDDPVQGYVFFNREVYMPRRDWFQLGIADFTAGLGSVSGPVSLVTGNNSARYRGDEYIEGRLAFYVKGDITRTTTLTASADTREQPVSQLFTNFTERDPLALLRRLDSNYSYPVYGDDGVLVDDAPTQGKFHVRLEREDSRIMWGSFRTPVSGTDLVRFNRGLYGAELSHRSMGSTQFGERKTMLDAFAADPGTVGSREEFRATGGSLYYLRNQDVLLGSERVFIETRDRESGIVLESVTLQPFQDYELNALQGRILLSRPLSSIQEAQGMVRTGAVSGNPVYLVVNYEYAPTLLRLDNFTMGGRVSQWIGDYIQIGLTGYSQQGMEMEQDIYGGDVTLRIRPDSYIRVEHANSEGRGAPVWSSVDGGFGFEQLSSSAQRNTSADAQRAEIALAFSDFTDNGRKGNLNAYWQRRGDGFSAPGQLNTEEISQGGIQTNIPLGSRLSLQAKGDLMEGSRSGESRALEAGAELFVTQRIYVQAGARNEFRETSMTGGNSARLSETGVRTDAVGLLGYQSVRDGVKGPFNIYALFQGTIDKDVTRRSNDRYGLGAGLRISDRVTISGEATDGDGGWGGRAEAEFSVTDRSSFYINYLMDPDRLDQGIRGRSSNFTTGGRVRYSESASVFMERRQETAQVGPTGLMHAFGLDLAPSDRWSYGFKMEAGSLSDPAFGDVDRWAASIFGGFNSGRFKWGGALEYRTEESSLRGERDSWLARNTLGVQLTDGWRILGRANVAVSDGGEGTAMDAEYTELVAGLAYRPTYRNRVNGLFRYTYLYDLASPDQLGPRLQLNPFAQKSHVFSADAIFKVTRHLSLGGKIGHRKGELRDRTVEDSEWFGSSAWLYIARADIHVVRAWDFIAEYRRLEVEEARDVRDGYLIGLYRHINTNLRLGVGYNFTDYTDDLTDLSFRSQGWFVNLIGMF